MEAPMVMMIRVTTSACFAGAMARRCNRIPRMPASTTARMIASSIGIPMAMNDTVAMPPIIRNSPWAKLMTWLAL